MRNLMRYVFCCNNENYVKKFTKRELLSLIGSLSFACKVVKPGRMFLRRLIDLSTSVTNLNHHISLSSEARADIHHFPITT